MYTIDDIKIGLKFNNPDPVSAFIAEVIELNVEGRSGYTKLKIIKALTDNPWFSVGKEFREFAFINHWNSGAYILETDMIVKRKSRLELIEI